MCSRATAAISGDSSMPTTPPCAPAFSRSKPQHSPRSAPDVEDHLPGADRPCLHDRLAVGAGMRWSLRPPPVTGPARIDGNGLHYAKRLTSPRAGFVPTFPFWESNASRLGMYRDLLITRSRS
jgi:hypothetical protein